MPIYEYRCPHCGETFEKLVPMTADEKKIECPKCGQKGVSKKISLFGACCGDSLGNFTAPQSPSCGSGGST